MTIQMTPDEEYKMINDEVQWAGKLLDEKHSEMKAAEKRWRQALLRYNSLEAALNDFLVAHPEYKNKEE